MDLRGTGGADRVSSLDAGAAFEARVDTPVGADGGEGHLELLRVSQHLQLYLRPQLLDEQEFSTLLCVFFPSAF